MNKTLLRAASFAMLMSPAPFAAAQSAGYPAKTVRWIVPFAPGGSVDLLARFAAAELSKNFGQQVVVDNRTGASGTIGTEFVARAAPDGYTIGSNTVPFVANTFLYKKVPYDVLNDFAHISLMAQTGNVLAVHPSLPARSVKELVQLARSKPGQLIYGTAGAGSNPHIAGELFNYLAKVDLQAVHYKGGYPAMVAAISGETSLTVTSIIETAPQVAAGKLRALGVTASKRSTALPNVPTIAEAGLPGYEFAAWHVLFAPKATPPAVVTLLSDNLKKILHAPGAPKQYRGARPGCHRDDARGSGRASQERDGEMGQGDQGAGDAGGLTSLPTGRTPRCISSAMTIAVIATPHTASQPKCANVQLVRNAPTAFPLHTCSPKRVLARARESGTAELISVWLATIAARRPQSSSIAPTTTAAIDHTPKPMATHAASIEHMPASTTGMHSGAVRPAPRRTRHQYARRAGDTDEARRGRTHAMEQPRAWARPPPRIRRSRCRT